MEEVVQLQASHRGDEKTKIGLGARSGGWFVSVKLWAG